MPQQLNLISEQVQIGGVGGGPALTRNNHISCLASTLRGAKPRQYNHKQSALFIGYHITSGSILVCAQIIVFWLAKIAELSFASIACEVGLHKAEE